MARPTISTVGIAFAPTSAALAARAIAVLALLLAMLTSVPARAQGVPGVDENKCLSGKMICVSKQMAGLLKCRQLCQKNPDKCGAAQTSCEERVHAKFDGGDRPEKGCFAKLERKEAPAKPDTLCTTTGDTAAVGARVTADVAALVAVLEGTCADEVVICPDGSEIQRDPALSCAFPQCPPQCASDLLDCLDGIFVGRDPADSCQFPECPPMCTDDAKQCPDGSFVRRDRRNDCAFFPCPSEP